MEIKKVGVMGCGAMGLGVAQVCAQAGIPTVAVKATPGPVSYTHLDVYKRQKSPSPIMRASG